MTQIIDPTHVYTFHIDPGHGWLEVPKRELVALGIADKISAYSYQKGDVAFLEEDCDASCFAAAFLGRFGHQPYCTERYLDRTPIRGYARYQKRR